VHRSLHKPPGPAQVDLGLALASGHHESRTALQASPDPCRAIGSTRLETMTLRCANHTHRHRRLHEPALPVSVHPRPAPPVQAPLPTPRGPGNEQEAVRELYANRDADLALEWVDQLSADMRDTSSPPEVRQLGRTMRRWRTQIAAWHAGQVSSGPTETMNDGLGSDPGHREARSASGSSVSPFGHDQLRPLAHPRAALRRPPRLVQARHGHPVTPRKSEEPPNRER